MKLVRPLCGMALLICSLPILAGALPTVPYVQVSGHGEVKVTPDLLNVTLSVTRTDLKLEVARDDVEKRASAVIALAKNIGIATRDIQAQSIRIAPEYTWKNSQRKYVGERVTRTFNLTLHDPDHYPALVQGLVKIGVSSVDAATPSHSDLPALRARALAEAMQDAHARAQTLANSAGVALGTVFSISENAGYTAPPGPHPLMMSAARSEVATPADYEPGVITISEDVSVVYLLDRKN